MKKTVLSIMLILAALFPLPASSLAASASHPIKVILKDGSIINGDMLGLDGGVLSIQSEDGRAKDISVSKIKKIFDANGKSIPLSGSQASAETEDTAPQPADEEVQPEPAPRHRAKARARASAPRRGNGARVAGNILTWSGLGVMLIGCVVYGVGASEEASATSTYYTGYYYPAGAVYQIPGKTGWYTYTQYYNYYEGESVAYGGAWVAVIGGVVGLTGIIIAASAPRGDQASLMQLHDGEIAWAVPQVNFDPRTGASSATLFTTQF